MAVWSNKFLSGEFRVFRKNGNYLVKSAGLAAIRTNEFLTGEFRVFSRKSGHYWLWALPWKFGGKLNGGRMKFVLFMVTDWVVSSGEMV